MNAAMRRDFICSQRQRRRLGNSAIQFRGLQQVQRGHEALLAGLESFPVELQRSHTYRNRPNEFDLGCAGLRQISPGEG